MLDTLINMDIKLKILLGVCVAVLVFALFNHFNTSTVNESFYAEEDMEVDDDDDEEPAQNPDNDSGKLESPEASDTQEMDGLDEPAPELKEPEDENATSETFTNFGGVEAFDSGCSVHEEVEEKQ